MGEAEIHDDAQTAGNQCARHRDGEDDRKGTKRAEQTGERTKGETGRKSMFVNPGRTTGLENFKPEESAALLGILFRHATRPEFCYRHRYAQGDVVMWDNRSLMHYAVDDYGDQPRYMERTTGIGEVPV